MGRNHLCTVVQILEEHESRVLEKQTIKLAARTELAACQAAMEEVQAAMLAGNSAATLADRLNMQHMRTQRST